MNESFTRAIPVVVITIMLLTGCRVPGHLSSGDPWKKAEEIVQQIQLPEIPERRFYLSEFGGVGDGHTDNKPAFDRIVSTCSEKGGGKIVVEPGTYLVNGPIHLKSDINLHLKEGAKLVFGNDPELYLPVVLTSWEGTRLYNYSPLRAITSATHRTGPEYPRFMWFRWGILPILNNL